MTHQHLLYCEPLIPKKALKRRYPVQSIISSVVGPQSNLGLKARKRVHQHTSSDLTHMMQQHGIRFIVLYAQG